MGLLLLLPLPAIAQPLLDQLLRRSPTHQFTVQPQAGKCPEKVGLWTTFRYYEGGGEHTVVANTRMIAGPASFFRSGTLFVEYRAPLKPAYTTCVGTATSDDSDNDAYRIRFEGGRVYFRVDVTRIAKNPATPAGITYQNLMNGQPHVRWAIAD
jgi:hypothetical protein